MYYRPIDSNGDFIKLIDEADAQYTFLGNDGTVLYFNSNHDVPRGQIIAIDIENSSQEKLAKP